MTDFERLTCMHVISNCSAISPDPAEFCSYDRITC